MIFSLPFHVARFFRVTVLSVFDLSNAGLGDIFAIYGITATLAYFPGGAIADTFSARRLMSFSLLATAAGGIYYATIPQRFGLSLLYGYWGVTSIFLFWAAMIKATRQWGGSSTQGSAFGILDGGRGLVAASVASFAVFLFGTFVPADVSTLSEQARSAALQKVILFYSGMTALAAVLVWFFVPDNNNAAIRNEHHPIKGLVEVLGRKVVWMQAVVVVCAYCGYKGLDNYGLYVVDVLGMDELQSSQFTSNAAYLRPLSAFTAGFLADRFMASRVITISFILLVVGYSVLSLVNQAGTGIIFANVALTFCAVYALRGVYFALLEETKVSTLRTGSALGLVSLVGFTPDIYFTPIAGRIIDAAPGATGHQHYFMLMVGLAVVGAVTTLLLRRTVDK